MAQKGEDLDQLFSFLSDEGDKNSARTGRDEQRFVDTINQDLDKLMVDETVTGPRANSSSSGSKQSSNTSAKGKKVVAEVAKQEKTKGKSKFKWKK